MLIVLGGLAEFERELFRARTERRKGTRQGARREDGPQAEAHRSPETGGDQVPRQGRGNTGRDWPQLQRVRLDDCETCAMSGASKTGGNLIGKGADSTINKLSDKYRRQRECAAKYLKGFTPHHMFWSPVVRAGLVEKLKSLTGFDLFINEDYSEAIKRLQELARNSTADVSNPAFRRPPPQRLAKSPARQPIRRSAQIA
jgi:hypothetical protein